MATRTRVEVVAAAAMGEASKTVGAEVGVAEAAAAVVEADTTVTAVAMSPEVVEVDVEAEVAWAEVTVVASINLVGPGTKDHAMTLNRIILIIIPSLYKAWVKTLPLSLLQITSSKLAL